MNIYLILEQNIAKPSLLHMTRQSPFLLLHFREYFTMSSLSEDDLLFSSFYEDTTYGLCFEMDESIAFKLQYF